MIARLTLPPSHIRSILAFLLRHYCQFVPSGSLWQRMTLIDGRQVTAVPLSQAAESAWLGDSCSCIDREVRLWEVPGFPDVSLVSHELGPLKKKEWSVLWLHEEDASLSRLDCWRLASQCQQLSLVILIRTLYLDLPSERGFQLHACFFRHCGSRSIMRTIQSYPTMPHWKGKKIPRKFFRGKGVEWDLSIFHSPSRIGQVDTRNLAWSPQRNVNWDLKHEVGGAFALSLLFFLAGQWESIAPGLLRCGNRTEAPLPLIYGVLWAAYPSWFNQEIQSLSLWMWRCANFSSRKDIMIDVMIWCK